MATSVGKFRDKIAGLKFVAQSKLVGRVIEVTNVTKQQTRYGEQYQVDYVDTETGVIGMTYANPLWGFGQTVAYAKENRQLPCVGMLVATGRTFDLVDPDGEDDETPF